MIASTPYDINAESETLIKNSNSSLTMNVLLKHPEGQKLQACLIRGVCADWRFLAC